MTFPTRWLAGLAAATLSVTLAAGCREPDRTVVTPADLAGRTEGSPNELWQHLGQLEQRFAAGQATDPESSRALLSAYTSAVIGTTDAIIADPAADETLRERAATFQFLAYDRRKAIDPNAEDELLAATDRVEAKAQKSRLKSYACEKRTQILGERAATASDGDRPQKYRALIDAVVHTIGLDPPPPRSAEVLGKLAGDCEERRLYPLAKEVEEILVAKYPDTLDGKFAKGALHRHSLKGKVIDDLQGLGRDGKPLSIKDFRGKVVIVAFWVSKLPVSISEIEEVDAFRTKYDPKDLQILGVATEPIPEIATQLITSMKLDWPQIESKMVSQNLESELNLRYGIRALSYRMVIDREGRLVDYGYMLFQVRPTVEGLLPPAREPKQPAEKEPAKPAAAEPPKAK